MFPRKKSRVLQQKILKIFSDDEEGSTKYYVQSIKTAITRLQFEEKTSELWKISFIAGILNIVLNIIFIPIFGIMAAAISTFIALLYMGFSGFYIKTYREVETVKYYPLIFASIIIGLTITVFYLKDMDLLFKGFISLLVLGSYFSYYLRKKMSFKILNEAI